MIKYTKLVNNLSSSVPFVGPETLERQMGKMFNARIGANESVFGPSPKAIYAMQNEINNIWMYGDPENYELKSLLAKIHDIKNDNIVIGEGIDGLLSYFVRLFVEFGTNVVTTDGAYPTFNYHVSGFGGILNKVEFKNDHEDPGYLLDEIKKTKSKIVYMSNPNNPMGTFQDGSVIEEFVKLLPADCILCLDEAYSDFVPKSMLPKIPVDFENVIRMRTFSKAYGMAGGRCGYAIGSKNVISSFNKIRNHFGINKVTQIGALASLKDKNYLRNVLIKINKSKLNISKIAIENNFNPIQSYTNFVTIDCMRNFEYAKLIMEGLVKKGVFVRMPFSFPQNRCIRVSAGTKKDLFFLSEALSEVVKEIN